MFVALGGMKTNWAEVIGIVEGVQGRTSRVHPLVW